MANSDSMSDNSKTTSGASGSQPPKKGGAKTYRRLGELLVANGTITEEELQKGLALQKGTKKRLGEVLIDNNIITETQMIDALRMQLGIEFINLTRVDIPVELAQILPKSIARQYHVVPVRIVRDELFLAMSDPLNFYALEEARKAVRRRIVPMVATAAAIEHSIRILYGNEGVARAMEEMKREIRGTTTTADDIFSANNIGEEDSANAPTIRLVNSIVERAVNERASDIHIEPGETGLRVRMRVDGILREILSVPPELQASVTARFKVMSGMDTAEHRIPQDGRFNVQIRKKDIDLRVSTLPTVYGEKIVCRLLDKSAALMNKKGIGMTAEDLEKFNRLMHHHSGVVLIAGPTGSGKSTTMYTMIGELNTPEVNLVTLEDPVEYNIAGINQVQINEKTGMTFASGLRSILRQDPDIIAVGEIRDGETGDIAMRSAITGHVVLSTIHTNDAVGTIERLMDIGIAPYLISSAMNGVISQRLVRRICPSCRQAYEPSEEEREQLKLKPGDMLYRGKGCADCFDTGYHGRIGVFEILEINRKLRQVITKGLGREEIEAVLNEPGSTFTTLQKGAEKLVKTGETTYDEYMRVIHEND
ncbi:MAG: GspE/PulE family protein [Lachnospiraceae bacterium]|nr:GspE/PulE family protein [Lachnospiraceae bacterium]